ncbi:hypothetical protein DXT35_12900 [Enterococcus faecalis]|uniref:Uncharacterized protein n=1 Tax=Enterococcus faecalis ERV63 TaxID=1134793 RepID=A0AAV3GHW9_ENTFL|nr:hypothetical protein [Enterococcus faecalis]EJU90136.1 hypothetical protein HMPREF1329_00702 [Enterococcus faecalis ERV116]EJV14241.1 hypothetical protein HMPREF1336_02722 [Enterococcus faecalis ERV63]EJV35203.1 hypothetical protein HMPREF1342_01372 [Enterococcus faecalis ERV85]TXV18795.1 hypothetical protein D4M35_02470 [Enterococcus sp. N041.A-2]
MINTYLLTFSCYFLINPAQVPLEIISKRHFFCFFIVNSRLLTLDSKGTVTFFNRWLKNIEVSHKDFSI